MNDSCPDLDRFVRGELDGAAFPHGEHVRMGFEMLRRHDFAETVFLFSRSLKAMTLRAGAPQAFHQTVTIAFLSLIAERLESETAYNDFEAFARANPDLFGPGALASRYSPQRLAMKAARRTFLLPDATC